MVAEVCFGKGRAVSSRTVCPDFPATAATASRFIEMRRVARGRCTRYPDRSPVADCAAYAFRFAGDPTVLRDTAPIKAAEHFLHSEGPRRLHRHGATA